MKKNTIKIVSLGCSKNLVDSEVLMGQIQANGLELVANEDDESDIVIINTCGFIKDAKEESIDTILNYAQAKKNGKVQKVIVMGCLSERYTKELKAEMPDIDNIYGVNDIPQIVKDLGAIYKKELIGERKVSTPSHFAYFKISEGCNHSCAFCAIPGIRGKHKSRSMESLIDEAQRLASKGVKELIMIAQDLTYYGVDNYGKKMLGNLLEKLAYVEGIEWIRLHYAYPTQFPEDVLSLMASNSKICKYLDIPLQHNDDRILKSMRRSHNSKSNRELVAKFREMVPGLTIRTTFIVGFPGETDEEFEHLKDFVREMRFDRVGVFTYSHEEDTHAFSLEDNVPQKVKDRRAAELMQIQEEISLEKNLEKVGKTFKVIVDRLEDNFYVGRTEGDSYEVDNEVLISSQIDLQIGEFYNVEITDAETFDIFGIIK
ncbi:MAG: ribosomal protein S12 methylthiotransferase RimO [Bacteroidetes bacterium CG2_30_33_31]|nr:MAG: ribosomal protein S12 methylthiotransferase RimO [Bacteroidetes bacterium CG2_30_33_31]